MASRKKQRGVVVHEEAASIPAAAHPLEYFAPPKLGRTSEGGMAGSTAVEVGTVGKPNMNPDNRSPDVLSPDSICKGIKVTLDNNSMWNEFYKCRTEMILTKQGCRMFPYCRFRISGLQPSRKYSLVMDIQPLDNSRYRWTGSSWLVAGEAASRMKSALFCHPESPSTGQHWMQNPVSFYKLKLTNNIEDQEGNVILYPMHRYLPRLHLIQTDKPAKAIKLNGPAVLTFTFPQTEFMAVTGYQNSRFTQLKVDYNPFAKGLKEDGASSKSINLKLNSKKDPCKDEGTTANPVKKSLKSLLANHKPRNSKASDPKPSEPCDLQNHCTTNRDQSAAKSTEESSCSPPAQKLFSELIREAHVSLQRCSLQQLGINNNIRHKTEQTNTKTTTETLNRPEDSKSVKTLPGKTDGSSVTKRRGRQDPLNPLDCRNTSHSSAPKPSTSMSVDSDKQQKTETQSEEKAKQHKRPAPLPLPALALFLKQHSTKSKKNKSRQDSPPRAPLPELPPKPPNSAEKVAPRPVSDETDVSKDLTEDNTESKNQTDAPASPKEKVCSVHDQAVETSAQPSSPLDQDTSASSDPKKHRTPDLSSSDPGGRGPELADGSPLSPSPGQPLSTIISSSHTTSSPSLHTSCHPVLPVQESLLSDPLCMKSDSLLPDPECSSFGFEPMSPASSPEPLPSLPVSFTLELDSTTAEPTPVPPGEFVQQNISSSSVFKWHTVLPPPEHYNNSSFSTFQAPPDSLPLASVTSPVLPLENPPLPEPQSLDPSTPPPEAAPSFEVNEQALPFPAELSPLALQLPLSPTFSLDGEGLSPTPSLTDLVQLFSIDVDLGMGVEFSNSEMGVATCLPQSTGGADAQELSQPIEVVPARKPGRPKKKCRRRKVTKTDVETVNSTVNATVNSTVSSTISSTINSTINSTYVLMQPNLEEVEEQLFVSFTSKEALKLHVVDSLRASVSQPQTTPEVHLQPPADSPEQEETKDSLDEKVASLQKVLLKDLKLMRHRQVIHPVLQEVGLKMNLLDPTQAIDLRYLGVRLPIPPPGVSVEPVSSELSQSKGTSGAFMSRTGKTTDVTQIKGWREKFSTPEAPPPPAAPEAGPGSDPPKKNLSAFCSDMLDEYLENEGKLIDQRADSFSQPQLDPPVYQLPTTSTSYVRTLDSILKKQPSGSPTSDLISGFVPPSKRPKPSPNESKNPRTAKRRGPKLLKPRPETESAPTSGSSLPESNLVTKQPAVQTSSETHQPVEPLPPSDPSAPIIKPKRRKHHPRFQSDTPQIPEVRKRRRLKPKTMTQAFDPSSCMDSPLGVSEDLAPLESDSELGDENHDGLVMTRALLRQKDLEDGGVWEGQPRARITEERAAIALTSLFTLKGFVIENPTKPVQVIQRRAPPCLNEFCRLGCVCSSLSYTSRISHCGRPACMLGCSCLKQKVVLLKNLEPDSSPSHQGIKKRRKRRMKMAYVLKEADSVSQPAERVQILWKKDSNELDPDPIHAPKRVRLLPLRMRTKNSSCARVRVYQPKKRDPHQKETPKVKKFKDHHVKLKKFKKPKDHQSSNPPTADGPDQLVPSLPSQSLPPEAESTPKPSKRLIILAEGKWGSDADRSHVLKQLCERMAHDQLDQPFWVWGYRIAPIGQTVEGSGPDRCIQYRVHISRPERGPEKLAEPVNPPSLETSTGPQQQQNHLKQVSMEEEIPEDWQREVEDEGEDEDEDEDEDEPLEDWQHEVEEEDESEEEEEEAGSTRHQVHVDPASRHTKGTVKRMDSLGLPWLTGVSPAGFLSTNRKQPGGTDYLVQVNGKLYPLAKIQLGQMGALHPANRLAAYLTGRVGSNRRQLDSSKPLQNQNLGPTPNLATSSSSAVSAPPPKPQPSVPVLTIKTTPPEIHHPNIFQQSAEGGGQKVFKYKLIQCPTGCTNQVRVAPEASANSTPSTDNQLSTFLGQNPAFQSLPLMVVPAQGPSGKLPVRGPTPLSTSQRMILKPVQTTSGAQFFRRPDGKLVQLFPISQLRPVNPSQNQNQTLGVLPPASCQTPSLTIGAKTPPQTALRSVSVTSLPTRHPLPNTVVAKNSTCNIKILPSDPTKEPIVVTCVKVPPPPPVKVLTGSTTTAAPKNLLSLSPSTGRGVELGVKTVTVAPVGLKIHQNPQIVTQTPPPAPTRSEVTHLPSPGPAAERVRDRSPDLMDLDIMCEETEIIATEMVGRTEQASHTETKSGQNSPKFNEETQWKNLQILRSNPPVAWEGKSSKDNGPIEVSTDLVSVETREGAMVEMSGAESSESEILSDSEVDTDEERASKRHLRSLEARQQRMELSQLFEKLEKTLELQKKPSRITILNKAEQVIQELRKTETNLTNLKRQLIERNNFFLNIIVPTTESNANVMEAELLDYPKKNFSGEEKVVTMTANMVDSDDHSISRDQKSDTSCQDLNRNSLSRQRTITAFKALQSVLNDNTSSKQHLLKQAQREIQSLRCEMKILKSLKSCLRKQKDAYLRKILQRSAGRGEQGIFGKHSPPKETLAANQLPASEGGGVSSSANEDNVSSSLHVKQQQASMVPPAQTPSTTATTTNTPVPVPVPLLVPSTSSHLASVTREKVRTIPNILSRSKKTVKESPSIQALVPTQVLSLVGASLPGQPVLTMSPLMSKPTATPVSTGVASVTLNISGLTSQQIHLTPVLGPQTGKIYGSSNPVTITNLAATNVNNLLQLVQQTGHEPTTKEQQQTQQGQQTHLPTLKEPTQEQATTKQQKQMQQQTPQQQQPTTQKQQQKETKDQLPQISQSQFTSASGLWEDSSCKRDSDAVGGTEDSVGGVTDLIDEVGDSLGKADNSVQDLDGSFRGASGLTSLLHEIDFLNQQNATARTAGLEAELQEQCGAADKALDQGEPWLLELDSDSEDTATVKTSETEPTKSQAQSGFLTPPPLLQMKVGRTKEADPALTELAAGEGGGEKGLSWKPMPRLVPLGLRGHAPS